MITKALAQGREEDWIKITTNTTKIKLKSLRPLDGWEHSGWGLGLRLALELVSEPTRETMSGVIRQIRIGKLDPTKVFKSISNQAKVSGCGLCREWKEYVNWELLGGYQMITAQQMGEEVAHQVTEKAKSEEAGSDRINRALESILGPLRGTCTVPCSQREFLLCRDKWAKNTSGYIGLGQNLGRQKIDVALNSDIKALERMMEGEFENRPFIKSEPGKSRPVVNSNISCYLNLEYGWVTIKKTLKKYLGKRTTIFDDASQKVLLWQEMIIGADNHREIKVPLDYSRFDSTIGKTQIMKCVRLLLDMVRGNDNWKRSVTERFERQTVYIDGYGKLRWENSVLSGWRWTSIITSVINLAILKATGADASGVGIKVQGDDVKISFQTIREAERCVEEINALGYEINPGKVFASRKRDEYLRMVAEEGKMAGYVIRCLPKIVFTSPTEEVTTWEERIRGTVSKWMRVLSRGGDREVAKYWMKRDLCGLSGENSELIDSWLRTPASVGGGGCAWLLGEGNLWTGLVLREQEEAEVVERSNHKMMSDYGGSVPARRWIKSVTKGAKPAFGFKRIERVKPLGNWLKDLRPVAESIKSISDLVETSQVPKFRFKEIYDWTPFMVHKRNALIEEKNWDKLCSLYHNEGEVRLYKRILPRWMWLSMIKNELTWVSMPPNIANSEVASLAKERVEYKVLSKVLRYHRTVSRETLTRFSIGGEYVLSAKLNDRQRILQ
ncbi:RNA-dependent RNA polymerase [Piscine myocarditis virus AL V-708]|uniref:RNA-directed RNA polymerase n=3 Tax=unclassified Totiviridae TaxID=39756 RepID=E3W912_9VIRU|nr:ORF2 [Piscine myocarditis virus AL V-708]ADP37187.1 RNA-dependent RNA polymerase [Piscine myocarditis virus AL V-708]